MTPMIKALSSHINDFSDEDLSSVLFMAGLVLYARYGNQTAEVMAQLTQACEKEFEKQQVDTLKNLKTNILV